MATPPRPRPRPGAPGTRGFLPPYQPFPAASAQLNQQIQQPPPQNPQSPQNQPRARGYRVGSAGRRPNEPPQGTWIPVSNVHASSSSALNVGSGASTTPAAMQGLVVGAGGGEYGVPGRVTRFGPASGPMYGLRHGTRPSVGPEKGANLGWGLGVGHGPVQLPGPDQSHRQRQALPHTAPQAFAPPFYPPTGPASAIGPSHQQNRPHTFHPCVRGTGGQYQPPHSSTAQSMVPARTAGMNMEPSMEIAPIMAITASNMPAASHLTSTSKLGTGQPPGSVRAWVLLGTGQPPDLSQGLGPSASNMPAASHLTSTSKLGTGQPPDLSQDLGPRLSLAPPSKEDPTTLKDNTAETEAPPILNVAQATYCVTIFTSPTSVGNDGLPTVSVLVALYSPMGLFLPPLQPLILSSNTRLRDLVLMLQEQLLANLRHSGSLARLLVQSIQVRVFDADVEGSGELPRIEGWLSGDDNEVVGETKWIAWDATGGEGESERFWGALIRKMLVDVLRRGDNEEVGKGPVLKVRTVAKVSELVEGDEVMGERISGGGHLFHVPVGANLPSPTAVAENVNTPQESIAQEGGKVTNKEAAEENTATPKRDVDATSPTSTQNHSCSTSTSAKGSFTPDPSSPSQPTKERKKRKHENAEQKRAAKQYQREIARSMAPSSISDASIADNNRDEAEQIVPGFDLSTYELKEPDVKTMTEKGYYKSMMGNSDPKQIWVQKGGYPKDAFVDPENNWGIYQRWGEKPTDPGYENRKAFHDTFPLNHIPFNGPTCKPWGGKKNGVKCDDGGDPSIKMVPFMEVTAELLKQMFLEERNKPENLPAHINQYCEEQERIMGMAEIDDKTFIPASKPNAIDMEAAYERRFPRNSAYFDGPSNDYEQMSTTDVFGHRTKFNGWHAGTDDTFRSSRTDVELFHAVPGFYDLSMGIITHRPAKGPRSFISNMSGPERRGRTSLGNSFAEFNSMAQDYDRHRTTGNYEQANTMGGRQNQGRGGLTMGRGNKFSSRSLAWRENVSQRAGQYNQPFRAPAGPRAMQRKLLKRTDPNREGNEPFAFNNMPVASNNSKQPRAASVVGPVADPDTPPRGPSYVRRGIMSCRSRATTALTALHHLRSIPGSDGISSPAVRLAIRHGVRPPLSLGMGTPSNVPGGGQRTPSPLEKAFEEASMEVSGAAIASTSNSPQGRPSDGKKA